MSQHRWSKFWWQDWQRDPALRSCGVAARGLWIDMLAIAFDGAPRGFVTIGGKPATTRQLATICGITERQCVTLLAELEDAGVFSRNADGWIFSRRMVRDSEVSEAGREAIAKRWQKSEHPNSPPNREGHSPPHSLDAEADAEAESIPPVAPPSARAPRAASPTPRDRGCRIPDDWQPQDRTTAEQHGIDVDGAVAEFRDYWRGVAGRAGVKSDWEATWRNQVRHLAQKRAQAQPRKSSQMSVPDQDAELMRLMQAATKADETPNVLRLVR